MNIEERRAENLRIMGNYISNGHRFTSNAEASIFRDNCAALGVDPGKTLQAITPSGSAQQQAKAAARLHNEASGEGETDGDIYAVEFDGTLVEDKYPEIGDEITGAVSALSTLQASGCKLILWTRRTGDELEAAKSWCSDRGLTFDAINAELDGTECQKVHADYYVDSRSVVELITINKAGSIRASAPRSRTEAGSAATAATSAAALFNESRGTGSPTAPNTTQRRAQSGGRMA